MKKYSFLIVLLFVAAGSFAQSLDDVNKMMLLNQTKKAKDALEKFMADPKNAGKADAWYYKGRIYNTLSKDSGIASADALKMKGDAFEAFKKYQQMDAKEMNFVNENHGSYFDLYNGYFDIGAKEFNAKNFSLSFEGFKNALIVEDYVKSKGYEYNGFKFPTLDTSLIMNTAIAATQAKDEASAMAYYKKLTDANLKGDQYLTIYQVLVEYYIKKNDEANLAAILEKGKTLYPTDDYWTEVELDRVSKSGDKKALMAKYEELMKQYPDKYTYPYNLSVEIYNMLYTGDDKPAEAMALKDKLTNSLKAAINVDKGVDAKMLMVRHLYNYAYDFQDSSKKIKGVKPDDLKKKNDLKAQFLKKIDECIPYAEGAAAYFAAQPTLKPIQKANYKDVLDMLSQFYAAKGDVKKSGEYDKKKAEVDKM
ncbi:tetratricopeptide repeat protein [Ferruginibacter sp.]